MFDVYKMTLPALVGGRVLTQKVESLSSGEVKDSALELTQVVQGIEQGQGQ